MASSYSGDSDQWISVTGFFFLRSEWTNTYNLCMRVYGWLRGLYHIPYFKKHCLFGFRGEMQKPQSKFRELRRGELLVHLGVITQQLVKNWFFILSEHEMMIF